MKPVYIACQYVDSMQPQGEAGNRSIAVELQMTDAQVRAAVLDLIGGMPEQAAFDWFKNEMPDWFKVAA